LGLADLGELVGAKRITHTLPDHDDLSLVDADSGERSAGQQARPTLVLVTTRWRLPGLATEGARFIDVGPLDEESAVALFGCIAGTERVAAESDAARSVARLCGGLPLAVCVAGAKAVARARRSLTRLAAQLAAQQRRLAVLAADDVFRHLRRLPQAREQYSLALALDRSEGHRNGEATELEQLGLVDLAEARTDAAMRAFTQAREIWVQLGRPRGVAMMTCRIGETHRDAGHYGAAIGDLTRARQMFAELLAEIDPA
jgi:tetratricopeptide (TPR) repeat protein